MSGLGERGREGGNDAKQELLGKMDGWNALLGYYGIILVEKAL